MALETVTYLNDLVPANPGSADPKSQGDDQIRNVKTGLKNSFLGFLGAIMVTGTDGGVVNAYTLTPGVPLIAYSTRMMAMFSPTVTNTGACTLNVSGLGVKDLVSVAGQPLVANDLVVGRTYIAFYDGTRFRLDAITQNFVEQQFASGLLPGVNDPANAGKVYGSTGSAGVWTSLDGRGAPILNKGNTGTTAQVISYLDGEGQTITATGNHTMSAANFPAGRLAGVLLRMNGYGSYTLTTTGISWFKADGTTTTTFSAAGIVLSTGLSIVSLFSYGDGTVYAKVMR